MKKWQGYTVRKN